MSWREAKYNKSSISFIWYGQNDVIGSFNFKYKNINLKYQHADSCYVIHIVANDAIMYFLLHFYDCVFSN